MKTLLLFLLSIGLFVSCQKSSSVNYSENLQAVNAPEGYVIPEGIQAVETPILAGQTTNVGSVLVWNDATNVYVSYQTVGSYKLRRTHLFVGSCSSIPVNGAGNPRIGLYPNQTDHGSAGVSVYTYTIPRSSLPSGCLCVSSHAEIVAYNNGSLVFSQTGWGQGPQVNDGGSWAMKFDYCQQEIGDNSEIR